MTADTDALLRQAMEAFDRQASAAGGCGDGYCCVTGKAKGMHTNGGCRCAEDRMTARRMMIAGRRLRDALAAASSQRT